MTLLVALLLAAGPAKLLPGATGKVCLDCHADFKEKLKKPFVHTPVKAQQCTGCHNPHAARHRGLLPADANKLCATCHAAQAKGTHKPVAEGACTSCHDPHASAEKFELVARGAQLCARCHKDVGVVKFAHKPVEQGCGTCHDAHGVSREVPKCTSCHKANTASFSKAHGNYAVAQSRCIGCHDPHGSDRKGLLYDTVHKPVAAGQCGECHLPPSPGKPALLKAQGAALCADCHKQQIAVMLGKARVHQAVVDANACLNCHSPHASRERSLVKGKLTQVCGTCHGDTIARQDRSPTPHPPVRDGSCATCHDPHASEAVLMLKKPVSTDQCATCHDYQKHSTHPIGEKLKDPRNPNLTLECLSCHRAHGTEYKHMMPFPTTSELCVKCHAEFKR